MRVLVTGCAGFIGSHLCERLLRAGHDVVGVDALTEYYDPALKLRNLEGCLRNGNFQFHQRHISEVPAWQIRDVDWIFHLAARPSVGTSWSDEFASYAALNIVETQYLLECTRGAERLRRFVYSSSSSVYGNAVSGPVTEEAATAPFSPYGVSKLAAEHLCFAYAENFGIPAVALRLFTVCGPRQRPDMLTSRLVSAILSGSRFTLNGDGSFVRDFTCVFDVVEAMLRAAERDCEHRLFNISGGQPASVSELIGIVQRNLGDRVQIERTGTQRGDVRCTWADLSRARRELGYAPAWRLEDTVKAQIESLRSRYSAVAAGGC